MQRYPHDTVRLERDRPPQQLVEQIRSTVARQHGIGTFRLHSRSGRRLAYRLRDLLEADFDVVVSVADPNQDSPRHQDWRSRWVTELLVRTPSH